VRCSAAALAWVNANTFAAEEQSGCACPQTVAAGSREEHECDARARSSRGRVWLCRGEELAHRRGARAPAAAAMGSTGTGRDSLRRREAGSAARGRF
jgi:hypothetical protein